MSKRLPSETWCALPWQGAVIQPWGDVQPCCYIDGIRDQSLQAYSQLESLVELKTKMLQNEQPTVCSPCWRNERLAMPSWRHQKLKQLGDLLAYDQKCDPRFHRPDYFEIYISNKCNSKCRMCKPKWSTAWFADYDDPEIRELFGYDDALAAKVVKYNYLTDERLDEIIGIIAGKTSETTISLRGGEPFYAEQSHYLLDGIARHGKASITHIDLSTNGTIVDRKLLDLMGMFASVKLGVSVDGSGGLNSYIRGNPTSVEIIYEHARCFLGLDNLKDFYISNTVQIYNAFDNQALKQEATDHLGFEPRFDDKLLFNPRHLKVHVLPAAYKDLIDNETLKKAAFTESEDAGLLHKWARWTATLDRIRGEDIGAVSPLLCRLRDAYLAKRED